MDKGKPRSPRPGDSHRANSYHTRETATWHPHFARHGPAAASRFKGENPFDYELEAPVKSKGTKASGLASGNLKL